MPAPELDLLHAEVTELTRQPELSVIRRRVVRRRRRHQVLGGIAVVLVVAAAAGVTLARAPRHQPAPPSATWPGPAPSVQPSELVPFPDGPVSWADAADGTHLYAVLSECGACNPRLVGSDDGGRTWTVRREDANPVRPQLAVYGAQTLSRPSRVGAVASTDGGRTWFNALVAAEPVWSVPAGGWLECYPAETAGPDPCDVRAVDPATRTVRPLATRPPMRIAGVATVPDGAGLWLTGLTTTGQPAVAVSRDAGATWSVHEFQPPSTKAGWTPSVTTRDGVTVYALARQGTESYGYRSTDGGRTWQPTNGGAAVPGPLDRWQPDAVLADGRQVLQQLAGDTVRPLVSDPGGARYLAGQLPQWPTTAVHVTRSGDLVGNSRRVIYLSTDGIHWTTVTPR